MGEHADLTAVVHLSKLYSSEPDVAKASFQLAVPLARQTRRWGYLLLALSLGTLAGPLGRSVGGRARVLRWISLIFAPFSFLLFLSEDVFLLDPGSAGGQVAYNLGVLSFLMVYLLLATWNGRVGWKLWKTADDQRQMIEPRSNLVATEA